MIELGAAEIDITPTRPGLCLLGQMHVRRAQYTHDPLCATAVVCSDGELKVALVSVDVCVFPDDLVARVQRGAAAATGIPERQVLVAATHTHVAPCLPSFPLAGEGDEDYANWLVEQLVAVIGKAAADLEPVTLFAGNGFLEQMGWNRRGRHGDRSDMYYGAWNPDFSGVEGPRDGHLGVIFCRDRKERVKVIISSFSTHPNTLEGESFYSADIPGAVRGSLRKLLGPRVKLCYLTGAAGNTAPTIMENADGFQPWRGEGGWQRSGLYFAGELGKVIAAGVRPMTAPALALLQSEEAIPLRPWAADFDLERLSGGARAYYETWQARWAERLRTESPWPTRLSVLRLGDAAVCTNPAEFFVEHGLAIKKDSPAAVTLIAELTDGYCGYVPTQEAFRRGGYTTWPARSSQLAENAGDQMVARTQDLLKQAFADAPAAKPTPA